MVGGVARWFSAWILLAGVGTTGTRALGAENGEELFVRRIWPLLQIKCLACHGNDAAKREGGLDLSTQAGMLRGGDSEEPALIPGKPERSPLFLAVGRLHDAWSPMPPKDAEKLTPLQMEWLKNWITAGAPWPDPARIQTLQKAHANKWSAEDGVTVVTSGGLSEDWTNRKYQTAALWAYQPVRKPHIEVPEAKVIDTFIARAWPADLQPAPPADARVFIRRATFDLTGLPPTIEEVETFVTDSARDPDLALDRLIQRLLDSPHYGERMAQHWLDVVRYADSSGFANDYERGNAWRYRDYVTRSFLADKPYNQFLMEQIAGDEMDAKNSERVIATGFLRMGPWELTSMEVAKIARQRFLDDVTNSVGETFLAHSLQCARCHDHKFDPVPTRDYYSIQAVFATTQLAERPAPFLAAENTRGFEEKKYLLATQADYLADLKKLDEKSLVAAEKWYQENQRDPAAWKAAIASLRGRERGNTFVMARNALLRQGVPEEQFPPRMWGWTPEEIGRERIARKGMERLGWELERYEPFALAVYNGHTPRVTAVYQPTRVPGDRLGSGEYETTCILGGGDPFSPGAKVVPGVLSVLGYLQPVAIPETVDGRRRAFAQWVAHPHNPLTTRTIVNRIWMWHFGEPLAGNPNNFGGTGKRPTHPELLDWLAATFVEDGWSFKALHRRIMTSSAYRRSCNHPNHAGSRATDSRGHDYAVSKPRRLSAEELRDAMLVATGELNRALGGIPNRPEINLEAAMQPRQVMGTYAAAWTPNPLPSQRHRRSLYALKLRGLTDPALEVFNAPAPDFSCERREVSTVTPQVFSLFNSQGTHARALALAARALRETSSDEAAIHRCFARTLGRSPRPDEQKLVQKHWREMELLQSSIRFPTDKPPLSVQRDAIEENTGERFSFQEILHANADFIPDLQPAQCDAHTRALADICLVLLNSNEFVYVY